jgi:hypothetical protein
MALRPPSTDSVAPWAIREVARDLDAGRTAAALLAGIQGGVVMMMSTGDVTPLEAALDLGIGYLRKTGASPVNN